MSTIEVKNDESENENFLVNSEDQQSVRGKKDMDCSETNFVTSDERKGNEKVVCFPRNL